MRRVNKMRELLSTVSEAKCRIYVVGFVSQNPETKTSPDLKQLAIQPALICSHTPSYSHPARIAKRRHCALARHVNEPDQRPQHTRQATGPENRSRRHPHTCNTTNCAHGPVHRDTCMCGADSQSLHVQQPAHRNRSELVDLAWERPQPRRTHTKTRGSTG